jgi:hypothetical protein
MNISAIPTDSELRALSLLIPTYFGLAVVERQVVMTLYTHGQNPPRPLVSYTIVPESQPDYTGLPNKSKAITMLCKPAPIRSLCGSCKLPMTHRC